MLHYYALRFAARLIENSVRRQKQIAKPYSTVSVDSQGVGSGDSCTYYVSAAPIRVGAYNEIERAKLFLLSSHLKLK